MAVALIGLGSNVGDRHALLRQAVEGLRGCVGVESIHSSSWHVTAPVGGPAEQGAYLNGAVRLVTSLPPGRLLAVLQEIELSGGRTRERHWGPRTLDLDLLLYDRLILHRPKLEIPHPRMAFRRFVLAPAAEVAADMPHPVIGWTVGQLLAHLDSATDYVAIAGPDRAAGNTPQDHTGSPRRPGDDAVRSNLGTGPKRSQDHAESPPRLENDVVRSSFGADSKTWLARRLHERFPGRLILRSVENLFEAAAGTGRSGQLLADAIKCLELMSQSFESPADTGVQPVCGTRRRLLAVSDFWFGELLVRAELLFRGDDFRRFRRAWQAKSESVPQPKLLLLFGGDDRRVVVPSESRKEPPGAEPPLGTIEPLCRCVQRSPPGPILWLPSDRHSDALREAAAAIEAMW
ncbi:MAG: 2-amino-4-hydroxy-6-hydroxymethyldihydropteridine diphosphokinase [Pirellulales bacterium]